MATKNSVSLNRPDIDKLIAYVFDNLPEEEIEAIEEHLWTNEYDACTVDTILELCATKGFTEDQMRVFLNTSKQKVAEQVKKAAQASHGPLCKLKKLSKKELDSRRGGMAMRLREWLLGSGKPQPAYANVRTMLLVSLFFGIAFSSVCMHLFINETVMGNDSEGVVAFFVPNNGSPENIKFYNINEKKDTGISWKNIVFPFDPVAVEGEERDSLYAKLQSILKIKNSLNWMPPNDSISYSDTFQNLLAGSQLFNSIENPKTKWLEKFYQGKDSTSLYIDGYKFGCYDASDKIILSTISPGNILSIKISRFLKTVATSKLTPATRVDISTLNPQGCLPEKWEFLSPAPAYRMDLVYEEYLANR